jgi:hypothetical protein
VVSRDSVERLSEVLTNLRGVSVKGDDPARRLEMLCGELQAVRTQLMLHDAQIAALREIFLVLKENLGR